MKKSLVQIHRTFFQLSFFCVAMGILESIVVVYLRQIYYPAGFDFPLTFLSPGMIAIEWTREFATIIMLGVLGILAGRDTLQRFCYFLFSFGIWDITYYAGLKLFLGWPSSFMTWDILFLIPVPWVSPVLAPVICSVTMIIFALSVLCLRGKGYPIKMTKFDWGFLFLGAFIIFYSYISNYTNIIFQNGFLSDFWSLSENKYFCQIASQYYPTDYNWHLFSLGEIMILSVMIHLIVAERYFIVTKRDVENSSSQVS